MGVLTLDQLTGLGQGGFANDCGPQPTTSIGETAVCCPNVGWVIYDLSESPYAICERAAALASGGGGGGADVPTSDDPIEARRLALEARRMELEERQFQQQLQLALMRGQLSRAQAAQAAEEAKERAKRQAELAKIQAKLEAERQEKNKKLLTYGAFALAAAKVLALF